MNRTFVMTFMVSLLLAACNTTVISDEDRQLPPSPASSSDGAAEQLEPTSDTETRSYDVDKSQSFIAFTGTRGDTTSHEGKFNTYTVTVNDLSQEDAELYVSINIDSMETDNDGLTNHLKSEDFFHVEEYPTATFVSTSVEPGLEVNEYAVTGDLTLHGVTQSVKLPVVMTDTYLTTSFVIDRTDFGVGGPIDGLKATDAEVPVEVKVVFAN